MRLSLCLAVGLTMASMALAPTTARAQDDDAETVKNPNAVTWGVGPRVRFVSIPTWLQNLFVKHSMPMNSVGLGLEAVRRKGNFDIVFGFEYEKISPPNGYYLKNDYPGSGPFTTQYLDFVTFDKLALIGLDVNFLWHAELTPWLAIRYGGGIGVALVLGDVWQADADNCPTTNISDLDDPNFGCTRYVGPMSGDVRGDKSTSVPPAVPIVNVLLGLRFKITNGINLNVEGGFRDMFFVGTGVDFFF